MNDVTVHNANLYPLSDLQTMAGALAKSQLFGVKTVDQALGLILVAQAEGRHPATIAQEYDIIQGRPALKSASALARFQHAGGKIQWIVSNAQEAEAEFSHPLGGTLQIRWDMERAKVAQLLGKDNWKKFPDQMLRARCVSEGVRAVFPACLNGMYVAEEVQDFDAPQAPQAQRQTRRAPIQTEHVDIMSEAEIQTLLADLKACGVTRDDIDAVMRGGKLKEMSRAQWEELSQVVHVIRSRDLEPGAAESTNTTTGEF